MISLGSKKQTSFPIHEYKTSEGSSVPSRVDAFLQSEPFQTKTRKETRSKGTYRKEAMVRYVSTSQIKRQRMSHARALRRFFESVRLRSSFFFYHQRFHRHRKEDEDRKEKNNNPCPFTGWVSCLPNPIPRTYRWGDPKERER